MASNHVVISGTGRAGTSFLVQLLTNLGMDTGFSSEGISVSEHARAGLEIDIRMKGAPYIIKSPHFCDYAEEIMQREDITIDHVFVPIRDLHAAAESRRFVVKSMVSRLPLRKRIFRQLKPSEVTGGLWGTDNGRDQETVLLEKLYKLLFAVAGGIVPVTLLRYPRLVNDSGYLYQKLEPIMKGISQTQFDAVFQETVRPEWVHRFGKEGR